VVESRALTFDPGLVKSIEKPQIQPKMPVMHLSKKKRVLSFTDALKKVFFSLAATM